MIRKMLGAFLLSVLVPGAVLAQSGDVPEGPTSLFGEVVDVRVVNLEVVVTGQGERVTGLVPEDFVLEVDGREVPIEYFTEVFGGTAVESGQEAALGTLPALKPGHPVETSYLLFIDEYFTVPPRRNRVLEKLIEQLPVLDPEDRMAVVAFNGDELEMLSSWSQSREALTRTLEAARERPAFGLQRLAERRSFQATRDLIARREQVLPNDSGFGDSRLDIEEEQEAELISNQVEKVVLAATSALRGFANPPGRKVMLLVSGGWPYDPVQWVTGDLRQGLYSADVKYGDELLDPLTETANRLSYTVYPIDVPAITYPLGDAELATIDDAQIAQDTFFDRLQNERSTLSFVARDTGGEALLGAASFAALERAAADTRSYYWIGFTPDWKGDDLDHKVKVDVRRKGLKVRSRRGFSDLSRRTEVTMMVESSLLFGDSPVAAPLRASMGEGKKVRRKQVELPLSVIIPVSELTFLPYEGRYAAEVELRIAVRDEEGNLAEVPVVPLTLAVDQEPREGELRRYDTFVRLRKRKHDVVVSIYDNASGKILATRLEVDPTTGAKNQDAKN